MSRVYNPLVIAFLISLLPSRNRIFLPVDYASSGMTVIHSNVAPPPIGAEYCKEIALYRSPTDLYFHPVDSITLQPSISRTPSTDFLILWVACHFLVFFGSVLSESIRLFIALSKILARVLVIDAFQVLDSLVSDGITSVLSDLPPPIVIMLGIMLLCGLRIRSNPLILPIFTALVVPKVCNKSFRVLISCCSPLTKLFHTLFEVILQVFQVFLYKIDNPMVEDISHFYSQVASHHSEHDLYISQRSNSPTSLPQHSKAFTEIDIPDSLISHSNFSSLRPSYAEKSISTELGLFKDDIGSAKTYASVGIQADCAQQADGYPNSVSTAVTFSLRSAVINVLDTTANGTKEYTKSPCAKLPSSKMHDCFGIESPEYSAPPTSPRRASTLPIHYTNNEILFPLSPARSRTFPVGMQAEYSSLDLPELCWGSSDSSDSENTLPYTPISMIPSPVRSNLRYRRIPDDESLAIRIPPRTQKRGRSRKRSRSVSEASPCVGLFEAAQRSREAEELRPGTWRDSYSMSHLSEEDEHSKLDYLREISDHADRVIEAIECQAHASNTSSCAADQPHHRTPFHPRFVQTLDHLLPSTTGIQLHQMPSYGHFLRGAGFAPILNSGSDSAEGNSSRLPETPSCLDHPQLRLHDVSQMPQANWIACNPPSPDPISELSDVSESVVMPQMPSPGGVLGAIEEEQVELNTPPPLPIPDGFQASTHQRTRRIRRQIPRLRGGVNNKVSIPMDVIEEVQNAARAQGRGSN